MECADVVVHHGHLSGARDSPDHIAVQAQAPAQRAFAASRLGLDRRFPWSNNRAARFRCANSPALVPAASRNLREHFVRIERRDDVARDVIEQSQMARFRPFLAEQPRIFERDDRFAGQHAHHFQVAEVERAFLRALHDHGADGPFVQQQGHAAEASFVLILWVRVPSLRISSV